MELFQPQISKNTIVVLLAVFFIALSNQSAQSNEEIRLIGHKICLDSNAFKNWKSDIEKKHGNLEVKTYNLGVLGRTTEILINGSIDIAICAPIGSLNRVLIRKPKVLGEYGSDNPFNNIPGNFKQDTKKDKKIKWIGQGWIFLKDKTVKKERGKYIVTCQENGNEHNDCAWTIFGMGIRKNHRWSAKLNKYIHRAMDHFTSAKTNDNFNDIFLIVPDKSVRRDNVEFRKYKDGKLVSVSTNASPKRTKRSSKVRNGGNGGGDACSKKAGPMMACPQWKPAPRF